LSHLRGQQHAGRATADNKHVDFVRKLFGPINSSAGGRLDAWIDGLVTVMMDLHCSKISSWTAVSNVKDATVPSSLFDFYILLMNDSLYDRDITCKHVHM